MASTNARNIDRTYGHIDLSTMDDKPHVTKSFDLVTRFPNDLDIEVLQTWTFGLRLPVIVMDTLLQEDWDKVLLGLETRVGDTFSPVENIIFTAAIAGFSADAIRWKVGRTVMENLYRCFVARQIEAGNSAWVSPSSMQKVSNPNA